MPASEREDESWSVIAHLSSSCNSTTSSSNSDSSSAGSEEEADEAEQASDQAGLGVSGIEGKTSNSEEFSFQRVGLSQKNLLINSTISQDHTGGLDQGQDALLILLAGKKGQALKILNLTNKKGLNAEEKLNWTMEKWRSDYSQEPGQRNLNATSRRWPPPPPPLRHVGLPRDRYVRTDTSPVGRPQRSLPKSANKRESGEPLVSRRKYRNAQRTSSISKLEGSTSVSSSSSSDSERESSDSEHERVMRRRQKPSWLSHARVKDRSTEPALIEHTTEYLEQDKYLEQALNATDEELREAERAISNLTSEEKSNMANSELDPITYYFRYLKNQIKPPHVIEQATRSRVTQTSINPKVNSLENPGGGKISLEESDEAVLSKKLEEDRSLPTLQEQSNTFEASTGRDPTLETIESSSLLRGNDNLQAAQHICVGGSGFIKDRNHVFETSTEASSYPEVESSSMLTLDVMLKQNRYAKLIVSPQQMPLYRHA